MIKKRSASALDLEVASAPLGPGIYRLVNLANDKCYVGQASNLRRRLSSHLRHLNSGGHTQPILRKAFAKHCRELWRFEVLERCARSRLTELETFYVKKFGTLTNGYNCAPVRAGIEPSPAFSLIARTVARNYHQSITDQKRSEIARRAAQTRRARADAMHRSEVARRAAATRAANRLSKGDMPPAASFDVDGEQG